MSPPELSDPYLQSFRNKKIKYVISERLEVKDFYPDTIEFDRQGNIVRIRHTRIWGDEERRAYDSSGFLVRRWLRSDVVLQYIARYSIKGDTLVQSWRELKSHDWDLSGDTTSMPREVDHYIFDQKGKLIHGSDEDHGGPIIHIYSNNKLVRKEIEVRINDEDEFHKETTAEYEYDVNGEIQKIKLFNTLYGSQQVFYFSSGLIDSCHITTTRYDDRPRLERFGYRYVYY